jgi:dUTP pyrophosphatase
VSPIEVRITRLTHGDDLPLPSYQTAHAAGLDLLAAVSTATPLIIAPGERGLVPTGLAIALPEGYEAQVRPRSGLAARHGLTILNAPVTITRGMRVAQLVVAPVVRAQILEVATLDKTERGSGGFGSTGS